MSWACRQAHLSGLPEKRSSIHDQSIRVRFYWHAHGRGGGGMKSLLRARGGHRRIVAGIAAAVIAVGLAGCSSGGEATGDEPTNVAVERGDELVVQFRSAPISIDP